ncbi:Aste57867_3117 [Aphanomyces stellatus]|uniref:Aste57867_3117 protein n=1 Tax=Aphanomyces stellatus TaxID=120398 RepID=A0A485K910_9STRA|nr:hypothetical protein As57867_003108 [Aphanomyces stellatus]VFT80293.1 Aste57867_3117 [Aphanomyces stellatus]
MSHVNQTELTRRNRMLNSPGMSCPTLANLSLDVLFTIATYLKVSSVLNLSASSTYLRGIVTEDPSLWELFCVRDFRIKTNSFPRSAAGWLQMYKNMDSPIVLTWGVNDDGRLGQPASNWGNVLSPAPIDTTAFGKIVSMSCSGFGMHALNQRGEVWFWGRLGQYSRETPGTKVPLPEPCSSVSSGRTFGCALGDSGAAYTWVVGQDARPHGIHVIRCDHVPSIFGGPSTVRTAKTIAAGWSHVAILLCDGAIKTCSIDRIRSMAEIDSFHLPGTSSDPIVHLAAGCDFTVALSASGVVYLWRTIGGPPAAGADLHLRAEFDTQPGDVYSHVSACLHRLSLLDAASGRFRLLDMSHRRDITPRWMTDRPHDQLAVVTHGDWHSGALLTNGQVWTWGNGSCALGLGNDRGSAVAEPRQIQHGLDGLFVFDIAFGGWHSAALAFRLEA